MTQIICLSAKKRGGKTTAANFIHGTVLKNREIIREFSILEDGALSVNTTHLDRDGNVVEDMGVLDLSQRNDGFSAFASERIWPHVKMYNFADALKDICSALFGLTHEQVHGSEKDTPTKLRWENMPGVFDSEGVMSAREVMQFIGTEIFRKMSPAVWTDLLMKEIEMDAPDYAVIADCRFDNEAQAAKDKGAILVQLTRSPEEDGHSSECGIVNTEFDVIIDNKNLSIDETHKKLMDELIARGVLLT